MAVGGVAVRPATQAESRSTEQTSRRIDMSGSDGQCAQHSAARSGAVEKHQTVDRPRQIHFHGLPDRTVPASAEYERRAFGFFARYLRWRHHIDEGIMRGLIGWLLASLTTGAIGAIATGDAREFYAGLVKPEWAPPGWLFGPVWTALYLLMGVAAWLVWRRAGWTGAAGALSLFLAQL